MIRRGTDLGYGLWSLPGGFVDRGEVVESAAAREAWEETGLEVDVGGLIGLFSLPGDPVIVAAYSAQETVARWPPDRRRWKQRFSHSIHCRTWLSAATPRFSTGGETNRPSCRNRDSVGA